MMKRQASLQAQLDKTIDPAERAGLQDEISRISKALNEEGGLDKYQQASIAGQSTTRGGDSSKILVDWLKDELKTEDQLRTDLSLLEVGCLSVKNACSQSKLFSSIERIDLNSQDPLIKKQDFMERPLPRQNQKETDRFDVISLSLVLNYVPDAVTRGQMLYRTTQFLKPPSTPGRPLPALFLVLPSPCTNNSRYLTEERLLQILQTLGYTLTQRKEAKKVVYWLLTLEKPPLTPSQAAKLKGRFKKKLLNDGKIRNNFAVVI
ncbi:Bmt2p [Sugiyamaella lignohabitans]|uniref:25S rRNA adenine-N(1) methyltransferase n=1 Tax=Sugiyamaella lignohabitans TaxID=796027 RepID=A0A161HF06_9ASCO|nr:Bmt2p [Sugiyamaella lignohabitans]ANB10981.1 Bmt2p [Sugiyamaella lignohabitans]